MKVIIYGIGQLAEYVEYVLSNDSEYHVSAFCVEKNLMQENKIINGLKLLDFDDLEKVFPPIEVKLFIAVGNNIIRERIYNTAKERGYSFISYVSSKAAIWKNLEYGDNVFIGEGSGAQPFVSIGNNCLLFAAKIGHHSKIGNNTVLSSCCLGGNTVIGDNSFLGLNSTVNHNIKVGRNNIIGAGANITKDTNDNEVYTNTETIRRAMSSQKIQDRFLL